MTTEAKGVEVEQPNLTVDGYITVVLKSGKHFTYRIRRGWPEEDSVTVALLTGSDNQSNYTGFGFVKDDGKSIAIWRKCRTERFLKHSQILLCSPPALEHIEAFYQAGTCRRCGKLLTNPESIAIGLGPYCAGKE